MVKIPVNLLKLKDKFSKPQKERFAIGVDIGTSAVKVVKLKFFKENTALCGFELEPTPLDLDEFFKKAASSPDANKSNSPFLFKCGINISVSGPSAIIRYLSFPAMSSDEMKKALKFESQKHIPFSIDEVNLDSYVLKQDLPDNKMLVLLAAVKKEFINKRLKIIADAGINVNIVDIDSIALINAFNFNCSQEEADNLKTKTIALLNIGTLVSNLNILEGRLPCLSRDIQIGGHNFTQKIADILGLDFKSAEDLKCSPDKERADKIAQALELALSNLAQEIRASFDYYENQSASSVVKIFLSGGGSLFTGLKDILANLLGIEVQYWNPLKQITLTEGIDSEKLKALSAQLAVAVGLALRI